MNKNQLLHRLLVLVVLVLLCGGLAGAQLMNLQLANGRYYARQAAANLTTTSTVSAARGEILDRYGRPLVTNQSVFSLVLVYSAWQQEGQYERLLELAKLIAADGGEIQDLLPISKAAPYAFTGLGTDEERETLTKYMNDSAEKLGVDGSATGAQFIDAMAIYFGLPATFSAADRRTVVGIIYSMRQVGFSLRASFTLAKDVSIDLIAQIKEHHNEFAGVDFESEAVRQYNTTYAAHLLGTVGPMYQEEWEQTYSQLKNYNMQDSVGKTGIEKALEEYLHGTDGSRTVEADFGSAEVASNTAMYAPEPGDNCILTIDLSLQQAAEDSLAENVGGYGRGGAAVVLDVNSGEVLAMASYPTYDLENFNKDYEKLTEDSRNPQVNRATSGVYAPGSTFKVLSAIAGLEEGVITGPDWTQVCTGRYTFFPDYQPYCNNKAGHGTMTVTSAIKYSCNVFFYEVGRQLTGEKLEAWAAKFGLGEYTGIEIGETKGQAAGPKTREAMLDNNPYLNQWGGGDNIQAAIGQSDNQFTPLQLANYIAAVVNGGTLYQPTLVKTVKSYDFATVVREEKPEVKNTIALSAQTLQLVKTGMGEVVEEGGTAASIFADYPVKLGGKTGTAETNVEGADNGVFVAFAPFDKPEIALCVVGEGVGHGSAVAPVVRDILDAYFASDVTDVDTVRQENTFLS